MCLHVWMRPICLVTNDKSRALLKYYSSETIFSMGREDKLQLAKHAWESLSVQWSQSGYATTAWIHTENFMGPHYPYMLSRKTSHLAHDWIQLDGRSPTSVNCETW
ncbi:hypothetical protein Y1Q_0011645 [Alligator mississippiensis]|uniref:Uncharacterized protein n=1 Tax=Alligator mississippiensis TaxID=8496 RepID=A0A151M0Q6_ALLMI|nr:hypothetical protein Y1Q_0011645 [Alligator mississippiensis]